MAHKLNDRLHKARSPCTGSTRASCGWHTLLRQQAARLVLELGAAVPCTKIECHATAAAGAPCGAGGGGLDAAEREPVPRRRRRVEPEGGRCLAERLSRYRAADVQRLA